MTFYERYEKCCNEAGIQPASRMAAEKLGCASSNITAFARSGKTPRGEIVAGAAKMLNVSADYLLGIIDTPKPIDYTTTEEEAEMINILRELNEEGVETALGVIRGLGMQNIYKKSNKAELDQKKA